MKLSFIFILIIILLISIVTVNAQSNSITGNIVFEENPNDVQQIYMKSIPAVVKIIVELDFERYLPNIDYIDWEDYNKKIEREQTPFYEGLDIDYDTNTNYYDILGDELGEEFNQYITDYPYSTGTGFIISPNGYILTSAHVLAIDENEVKEFVKGFYLSMQNYYMEDSYAYESDYTYDHYLDDWALYNFMYEKLEIRNLKIKTVVVLGVDKPGQDLNTIKYTPKLIDHEGGNIDFETGEYNNEDLDWALLKLDGTNFPTIPLGDSDRPSIGSQILVIGYPFVSEESKKEEEYITFKTNVEPTLTSGYISQISTIEKNKYFQVDLSVSEGNSGGPAFDSKGNVIGIVTSGLSGYTGGHYNYILRINDIMNRIEDKVKPSQGESDNLWYNGLNYYWNKDYIEAETQLNQLSSLNPNNPYLNNMKKRV